MKIAALSSAVVLTAAMNCGAAPDLSQESVAPDGLKVARWAESPLLYKPTNIDVDQSDRIWIAEGVNYRTFRGKDLNQPDAIPLHHTGGDRIITLEDTDGGGVANSSKVFVQDKDLVAPLGVVVVGQRVFVPRSPHLFVCTHDETADKPAKEEVFLSGFDGHDHDHGLHSVAPGPDGRLYFNARNAGPHVVTDHDGRTIRAGRIYTGSSPNITNDTPNMRSGGQFPSQFIEGVTEAIFRNPSRAASAMARQSLKRPARHGEAFPLMAELMKRRGDAARGKGIRSSESAACGNGHAFAGAGGDVGPDLATARTNLGREGVFDSILNPSAVIAAGYEPWLIETKGDETYSGFVGSDGETVTLKEPTGGTRAIPASQIASRRQQKLSLMPDGISLGLTAQKLVDLLEYLLNEPVAAKP